MAIYTEAHILDIEFNRIIKSIDENYSLDIEVLEEGVDIKGLVDKAIKKIKEIFKAIINKIKDIIVHSNNLSIVRKAPKSINEIDPEKLKKANEYLKNNNIILDFLVPPTHSLSSDHKFTKDEIETLVDNYTPKKASLNNKDDLDDIKNVAMSFTSLETKLKKMEKDTISYITEIRSDGIGTNEQLMIFDHNVSAIAKSVSSKFLQSHKSAISVLKMIS